MEFEINEQKWIKKTASNYYYYYWMSDMKSYSLMKKHDSWIDQNNSLESCAAATAAAGWHRHAMFSVLLFEINDFY